jgi:hypothetical protein
MKIKELTESTTAGAVASVAMPMGGTQKRAGSMFKGKKTKKKFYEGKMKDLAYDMQHMDNGNFQKKYGKSKEELKKVLGNPPKEKPVSEAEINEDDLILVPGHGKKLKPGFIPHDKDRTDHEVEMARSDLFQAAKNAQKVYELIKHTSEEEGLEGWVQEKIIKANDYLNTIREYLEHKTYMNEGGGVIAGGMSNFEEGKCPKCGGVAYGEEKIAEAKDACYHKVKSRYKVWPSAYASGALVKCRKVGASNWGNKSKK